MVSTTKCIICSADVISCEKTCPHCGAVNENFVSGSSPSFIWPKTIDELKEYCAQLKLPLTRLRFFIGENYQAPKAYGIYKAADDRFIVYKNKSDNTRSIRYDGPDEAYAVRELLAKLLETGQRAGMLNIK